MNGKMMWVCAGLGIAVLCLMAGAASAQDGPSYDKGAPNAEAMGWRLGCQAYSFNKFTFFDAVDKSASMNLRVIEAYPGQKLSKDMPDATFDHNMSPELQKVALDKLKSANVKLVNYGVVGLPNDEAECRKVFEFAKAMGIETICSEPPAKAFDLLDKLTEEYKINVAIHNHPKPSLYYDYKKLLAAVEGHSKRIGACADTGHWMRSGIPSLEAIKALEGRIISLHIKDLNEFGNPEAVDVVWGTGKADMPAILAELKRQGFKGVFSIEYENNWLNSVPEISQCVKFFDETAVALSKGAK